MGNELEGGVVKAGNTEDERYIRLNKDGTLESHRGFLTRNNEGVVDEVSEIYRKLIDTDFNSQSWNYRSQVLILAKRLFGPSLISWLDLQAASGYLYGSRLRFIDDTLCFIGRGRRECSIINWPGLLENHPEKRKRVGPNYVMKQYQVATYHRNTAKAISRWCSHPGGFEDMVCTLSILFGGEYKTR